MPTAAIQSVYSRQIITTYDILKPEFLDQLFRRRGKQGAEFFLTIMSMGFKIPTANEIYGHFEDDWIHEKFTVRANVADPGAGNNVLVTIGVNDLDANNNFYPRLYDEVLFKNDVPGVVINVDTTTPSAPVLTIRPSETTDNIGALTAGDYIIIASNGWGEGTGQPASRFSGTIKYENEMQIIKETVEVTGTSMTDQNWFKEIKEPGGSASALPTYYIKGTEDTEYRMALQSEGALLFGKKNTNNVVDQDGKRIGLTEGLIPYIRGNGNIVNYTPGSWTVSKFNQINKKADQEFGPYNYCGFLGIDFHDEIDDTFVDYLKDTNVAFDQQVSEGKKIDIAFSHLVKSGRNYAFKRMHSFSNPQTYGAPGYQQSKWGVFLPLGVKKDQKTKKDLPCVGIRHKKLGGYDRFMEVWNESGAGNGIKVTDIDSRKVYFRSHIGAHFMAGNQFFLIEP